MDVKIAGAEFERRLICAAWAEFRVSVGYRGRMSHYAAFRRGFHRVHDGEVFGRSRVFAENPHATDFDEVDPPRWFVEDELGAGEFEKTCAALAKRNADALERLADEDRPLRVTYPKNFYDAPRRGRVSAKVIYSRRHERGASLNLLFERAWLPARLRRRGEKIDATLGVVAFVRWARGGEA